MEERIKKKIKTYSSALPAYNRSSKTDEIDLERLLNIENFRLEPS